MGWFLPKRPNALFWIGVALLCLFLSLRFWLLVVPLAILWSVSPACAHSFYPYECCSDRDCWPTGAGADAREPDPVAGPGGWRLFDGTIVPYAATRPSPDGRFHVCRSGGALKGALIAPGGRPPCLWVPPNGS